MTAYYTTKANEVLDDVVNRYYQRQDNRLVEIVLETNPGLSDYGPLIPAGVIVTLPDPPAPAPTQRLQLFS